MNDFVTLYNELDLHILDLQKEFIDSFIPAEPSVEPLEYIHKVKAYCILAHAAFEEYFENISLKIMNKSIEDWYNSRRYNDTLVAMVATYGIKLKIDTDENNDETQIFDYLRNCFEDCKRKFSRDVYDNHGISLKYLRCLLTPVAIDIKPDINLLNSLSKLAIERGEYAHKRITRRTILPPEDAKHYVEDCLKLCEDIKNKAESKFV